MPVSSGSQVLLRDVGHVGAFVVLGEQVIERLVLASAEMCSGIDSQYSSVFEKVGSTSKITPRKG
jgi:hypothetical protein